MDNKVKQTELERNDTLAVAFSGGGIRSASFNLGVLEAFEASKDTHLDRVNMLSSVSGGGYTAAAFMSHLQQWSGDRKRAIKSLGKQMSRNFNYLVGGGLAGQFHFVGALVLGILANIITVAALGFIVAALIYNNHSPAIIGSTGNYTLIAPSNMTGTESQISSWLGFYHIPQDIMNRRYGSSIFHIHNSFLIVSVCVLGVLAALLIGIPLVSRFSNCWTCMPSQIHGLLRKSKVSNGNNGDSSASDGEEPNPVSRTVNIAIQSFLRLLLFLAWFLPLLITGIELLKVTIYLLGLHFVKEKDKGVFASIAFVYAIVVDLIGATAMYAFLTRIGKWSMVAIGSKVAIMILGLVFPLSFIIFVARICVWYIIEYDSMFSFLGDDSSLFIVEIVCWCVLLVSFMSHSYIFNILKHMYQYKLKKCFFERDWQFSELDSDITFHCNTTVNNQSADGKSLVHFSFSQKANTWNTSHQKAVSKHTTSCHTLSSAMALSGAAISVKLGLHDSKISSKIFRFILTFFNINLGDWVYVPVLPKPQHLSNMSGVHKLVEVVNFLYGCMAWIACLVPFVLGIVSAVDKYRSHHNPSVTLLFPFASEEDIIVYITLGIVGVTLLLHGLTHFVDLVVDVSNIPVNWLWAVVHVILASLHMPDNVPFIRTCKLVLGLHQTKGSAYLFHSDGGHFDNLGLYPLLKSEAKNIVVFDAEQDSELHFSGLHTTLVNAARDGLILPENGDGLISPENDEPLSSQVNAIREPSKTCFLKFQVTYPSNERGTIWYGKATTTGEEDGMTKLYMLNDQNFPHEPTSNQVFSASKFNAYRTLGKHVATKVLSTIKCPPQAPKATERGDVEPSLWI